VSATTVAWTEHHHRDAEAMEVALLAALTALIRHAVVERGSATLALAGGKTPLKLYRRLAAEPLPWRKVTLVPTDERWVDERDPASNVRALRELFAIASGVKIVSLLPPDLTAPDAIAAQAMLSLRPEPFDLVLLGMGSDGHIASLFPGARGLVAGLNKLDAPDALVIAPLKLPPEAPYPRVSLSLKRLLSSHQRWLVIQGAAKLEVLSRAKGAVSPELLPVAACLHDSRQPIDIHFCPDARAPVSA
jgi:6-phosphogluconolactonase